MQAKRFLAFWRVISRAGNGQDAARQLLMHMSAAKRKRAAVSASEPLLAQASHGP